MRVLVSGGAGYVGSVSVERLLERGHHVVVLDSLVTGHRGAVPESVRLVDGSTRDAALVERTLRDERIEAVLHCAARSLVGQSVSDPALYYGENVVGGVALLDAMRAAGVARLVFSSTAAVYGEPLSTPVTEDQLPQPVNPYGETKHAFEGALRWYGAAYGLRSMALRYFNVAGASARCGEDHRPETHLIPNVLAAALGLRELTLYGTDYPTADGTCIRDYIHVDDLADAHLAALELTGDADAWGRARTAALASAVAREGLATAPASTTGTTLALDGGAGDESPAGGGLIACNLGSGSGFSVRQVIDAAAAVVGRPIPFRVGPRRPGDPPVLVASNARAREVLGWTPRRGDLDEMIGSAWDWHRAHPSGYGPSA